MSQHDMEINNGSGATVRADLNLALKALASLSSEATTPATTFAYQLWADTTTGTLKQRNAANGAWLVRGTLAETMIIARSSNTIIAAGDFGKVFNCTSTYTQTLTAAATLGDGFHFTIRNNSTGVITIDPNGAESIDGATTITVQPGEAFVVWCTGAAWITVGRANVNGLTEDTAPDLDADFVMVYDASSGGLKKVKLGRVGGGVLGTPTATTSGTTIDYAIPSWAKKITMNLAAVSTDGTSQIVVRIGDSGGVEAAGYSSVATSVGSGTPSTDASTIGFIITGAANAVVHAHSGSITLTLENASTNTWSIAGVTSTVGTTNLMSGAKSLSGPLTTVQLTTEGGTDSFDSGEMNVRYE